MTDAPPGVDRPLLRVVACGSVDDGKSTLLGRLLHDAGGLRDDERATLVGLDSAAQSGSTHPDFARLFDGLAAEREQGITIDVAYRYFTTARRRFILADAPGHGQYTRNMVTGASSADVALLIVDAQRGMTKQTRRHARIIRLLGIRQIALVVNKLDLTGFDRARFDTITGAFTDFATPLDIDVVQAIPVSAVHGDNVVERSDRTPWFRGATLLDWLEEVAIPTWTNPGALVLPVQWVARPSPVERAYAGQIARGAIAPGDAVKIMPAATRATVDRLLTREGDRSSGTVGEPVMVALREAVACGRGDVIVAADESVETADQFETTLMWLAQAPLVVGRRYAIQLGGQSARATVQPPKYRYDIDTGQHLAAATLVQQDIGVAEIAVDRALVFTPYAENRELGGFILIDQESNETVAGGLVHFALRRSQNVRRHDTDVSPQARAELMGQRPRVIWFTGLSGAGKSTIANLVERALHARGRHTILLDGDNLRRGLNRNLGFTEADRIENVRRTAEVARLTLEAGLIVLVAVISPFQLERDAARTLIGNDAFIEVFVDAPLAVAEARDPKGLYAKARAGELTNFTGVDSPYERPQAPTLVIDTTVTDAATAAEMVVRLVEEWRA